MGFTWHWYSKAGNGQQDNQDYAGVALWDNALLAIITDGVSARPDSGRLACALVQHLVDRVVSHAQPPSSAELGCHLKDAFEQLKQSCPSDASAAYLAACFSADKLEYAVHARDCRIGLRSEKGPIIWKTEVHSLANATVPVTEEGLRAHPARNQLTRSFGTRRYKVPDITTLGCGYAEGAALATDGFWAGLPIEDQHAACSQDWTGPHNNKDDVSRLVVQWHRSPHTAHEDGPGIYVRRR